MDDKLGMCYAHKDKEAEKNLAISLFFETKECQKKKKKKEYDGYCGCKPNPR
jgi:hypothetical protein